MEWGSTHLIGHENENIDRSSTGITIHMMGGGSQKRLISLY